MSSATFNRYAGRTAAFLSRNYRSTSSRCRLNPNTNTIQHLKIWRDHGRDHGRDRDHEHHPRIYHKWNLIDNSANGSVRAFSSSGNAPVENDDNDGDGDGDDREGISTFTRQEMSKRHVGIQMNDAGYSKLILPKEQIIKTDTKTGTKRSVAVERYYGYFWMLKDLERTDYKPIDSNQELISKVDAQVFPPLDDVTILANGENVRFPQYFRNQNKSKSKSCTLLAIGYNEFGTKLLPSWTEPYEAEFGSSSRYQQVVNLSIHEGRVLGFLKSFIIKSVFHNVPSEKRQRTLLYFGQCDELRDMVRMHNNKTCYVYLLDGEGRVRFAGSGKASEEETQRLIKFAKKLTATGKRF